MAQLTVVALLLAVAACAMVSGQSKTIGKNSLTCITFDKPYFDWRGRFTASQGIWLKNVHVLRELNCGLDRACGRFHAPSKLEIPFFNYNDFFDFSVSVWFKREGGIGCWPVLVSNGDCSQRTIQISSKDDTHLIVTVRTSAGTTYEETFVTESQSAAWRHVVVTVHVGKWRVKGWTKVYIDGKKVGQGHLKGKMPPVSFPMFVGSNACGPCKFNYFNGLMDSISFSRYALTADEVSQLYSSRGLCIGLRGETEAMAGAMANVVSKNWALIVAGSHMYHNYRHQADACHAYQILKKNGIPEDRIVLMIYDDIVNHDKNPKQGKLYNKASGPDVYAGVKIDYDKNDVTAQNFLDVLSGNQAAMAGVGSGRVINSGINDNVFVFYSNHGGFGCLEFPTAGRLYARRLNKVIEKMHKQKKYKEMVFYIEACHSGSMFKYTLRKHIGVYATTAAGPYEYSYTTLTDPHFGTPLGDVYSVTWMADSEAAPPTETLQQQYQNVRTAVTFSHVSEYGQKSVSAKLISKFQGPSDSKKRRRRRAVGGQGGIPQMDVPLAMLRYELNVTRDPAEIRRLRSKIDAINRTREAIIDVFARIAERVTNDTRLARRLLLQRPRSLYNFDCYEQAVDMFSGLCYNLSEYDFALHHIYKLANLCQEGSITTDRIIQSIEKECLQV